MSKSINWSVLTSHEREIVSLVRCGYRDAQIAAAESVSIDDVKAQLQRVFKKLGVSDRFELAMEAARHGL